MTITGPRPGRPGHLADHEALAAELLALDVPGLTVDDVPPHRVPLIAPWGDYGTAGEYQPLQIARSAGMAVLFGIAQAKSATAGESQIATLPAWAAPQDGWVILAAHSNSGVRLNVRDDGTLWAPGATVANGWWAVSTAWRVATD